MAQYGHTSAVWAKGAAGAPCDSYFQRVLEASTAGDSLGAVDPRASENASTNSSEVDAPRRGRALLLSAKAVVTTLLDDLNQSEVRGANQVHALIEVFEALGDVESKLHDYRAAAAALHKAKSAALNLFSPDHERCALLQHKLAEVLLMVGHCDDAYHLLL